MEIVFHEIKQDRDIIRDPISIPQALKSKGKTSIVPPTIWFTKANVLDNVEFTYKDFGSAFLSSVAGILKIFF